MIDLLKEADNNNTYDEDEMKQILSIIEKCSEVTIERSTEPESTASKDSAETSKFNCSMSLKLAQHKYIKISLNLKLVHENLVLSTQAT